ncbi:hypothetical protein [Pelistega sp. MC2]|uniref:hypothetical protein n=1 Tax=Pelistega sp. MC2 TaxID=1720297 RepID=UPI0008D91CBF|nr:hypothetical protein [Pelistega sp. MC2]
MSISVFFGTLFLKEMKNFPQEDIIKIGDFARHVASSGFLGLPGKNKMSDNVPKNDPNWLYKVKYAQDYNLWHYHIGIPKYNNGNSGHLTSEYVLHYIKGDGYIKIVDMTAHPPMILPKIEYLK